MKKNTASQKIGAQMVSATDGSAFTGSVTVYVTGDAGTQATGSVGSGACTHEGNGYHTYAPAQAETNYDLIAFTFTGTGAVPATVQVFTSADANVIQWLGTAVSTPTVAGVPNVNCKTWNDLATVALPLVPTTAGRTLDVSAGGEAGVDWSNVGSPTTSLALTGTTIAVTQKVDVETIKTNPVANAGTVTFPTNATLASTTNITAGTITTVTTVTNQLTAAQIATGVWQDTTAGDFTVALSIGKSIMNGVSLGTGLTVARCTLTDTLTTYTGNTPQTGDSFALIGATGSGLTSLATQASVNTIDDFLDTEIAAIKAKTDQLVFTVANTLNVNVQYVNDVQVNGDGQPGTEWGP